MIFISDKITFRKNLEGGNVPKISVTVPIYNAEKFLQTTVQSILSQTFTDFELILIDDCSTDKTLDVAKSFDDARIKILRTEKNLGYPGAVRNVGLEKAVGEYVFFMDHDDILLPNAFKILAECADKNFCDVVTATSWFVCEDFTDENAPVSKIKLPSTKIPVSSDIKTRLWNELVLGGMYVVPWCSLYRRNFLVKNKIKFPVGVAEDVFFTVDVLFATYKIVKINIPFYIWHKSKSSASQNVKRIRKNLKSILALNDWLEEKLAPLNDPTFSEEFISHQVGGAVVSYFQSSFKSAINQ